MRVIVEVTFPTGISNVRQELTFEDTAHHSAKAQVNSLVRRLKRDHALYKPTVTWREVGEK